MKGIPLKFVIDEVTYSGGGLYRFVVETYPNAKLCTRENFIARSKTHFQQGVNYSMKELVEFVEARVKNHNIVVADVPYTFRQLYNKIITDYPGHNIVTYDTLTQHARKYLDKRLSCTAKQLDTFVRKFGIKEVYKITVNGKDYSCRELYFYARQKYPHLKIYTQGAFRNNAQAYFDVGRNYTEDDLESFLITKVNRAYFSENIVLYRIDVVAGPDKGRFYFGITKGLISSRLDRHIYNAKRSSNLSNNSIYGVINRLAAYKYDIRTAMVATKLMEGQKDVLCKEELRLINSAKNNPKNSHKCLNRERKYSSIGGRDPRIYLIFDGKMLSTKDLLNSFVNEFERNNKLKLNDGECRKYHARVTALLRRRAKDSNIHYKELSQSELKKIQHDTYQSLLTPGSHVARVDRKCYQSSFGPIARDDYAKMHNLKAYDVANMLNRHELPSDSTKINLDDLFSGKYPLKQRMPISDEKLFSPDLMGSIDIKSLLIAPHIKHIIENGLGFTQAAIHLGWESASLFTYWRARAGNAITFWQKINKRFSVRMK